MTALVFGLIFLSHPLSTHRVLPRWVSTQQSSTHLAFWRGDQYRPCLNGRVNAKPLTRPAIATYKGSDRSLVVVDLTEREEVALLNFEWVTGRAAETRGANTWS